MKKLKAFYLMICFLFLNLLSVACKFPDNILDLQNIKTYKLDKIKFGQTTIEEFTSLVGVKPDYTIENVDIYNTVPVNNVVFKKIRVGFKDKKLDWIEFYLNGDIELATIADIYGKPDNINQSYSKIFDYYDYKFFNISTDKQHKFARTITIFDMPESSHETIIDLSSFIPKWQDLKKRNILGLKPGYSLESDFNDLYPDLLSVKNNKTDYSVYILDKELGKAKSQYESIELVFINGLLNWIYLVPLEINLNQLISLWGKEYQVESISKKHELYDFNGIIAVVNKNNKKVVKIGIITDK